VPAQNVAVVGVAYEPVTASLQLLVHLVEHKDEEDNPIALCEHGIEVSANTVRRLLREMQFSLRTNRKNIESGAKRKRGDRVKRNRQFWVIATQRRRFETADLPVISAKKLLMRANREQL
jgi:hypothetical protein